MQTYAYKEERVEKLVIRYVDGDFRGIGEAWLWP